jgi:hypothetical protein
MPEYWERYGQFDGLTRLDTLELDNEAYQFYELGLWREDEGAGYFLATDSGCSCPTPWESLERDDLTGPLTREQAEEEARSLIESARQTRYGAGPIEEDVTEFLANFN